MMGGTKDNSNRQGMCMAATGSCCLLRQQHLLTIILSPLSLIYSKQDDKATEIVLSTSHGALTKPYRGISGYLSDKASAKMSMRGRILVQANFLLLEGACIFVFSSMTNLAPSIVMLTIFLIFVQAAEGSTCILHSCIVFC